MKNLKKLSLIISMLAMVFVVSGCSTEKVETEDMNNFTLKYEAKKEVDEVICSVDGFDISLSPMHDDKKVKEGYSSNTNLPEESDVELSIKIMDEGKIIFETENEKIDLSKGEKVEVSIVDKDNGNLGIDVNNK